MFCTKCGCQLYDGVVFCHNCGTQVGSTTSNNSTISQDSMSTELNHDALKIYLYDILTLECIKNKYNTNLGNANWSISKIPKNFYEKCYTIEGNDAWHNSIDYLYFCYMNGKYYLWTKVDQSYGTFPLTERYGLPGTYNPPMENVYIYDIEENYKYISGLDMWSSYRVTGTSRHFEQRKRGKKARNAFLRCYADFKKVAASGLQDNVNALTNWTNYKAGIEKGLDEVDNLLSKEYNLNIIPSPFRYNIYTIYYLYDFISTSNQSLTTALMHCDLNEIKMKLDCIIQQQQEIIIQQARMIAQNEEMIAQNQFILKKLSGLAKTASNIEYNTAQTEIYSAIAARNAEVCAWISTAQYLKN